MSDRTNILSETEVAFIRKWLNITDTRTHTRTRTHAHAHRHIHFEYIEPDYENRITAR